MRRPSRLMLPSAGDSMPDTVFWVVVLPAPLAPSRATISPVLTVKLMPLSAAMAP